MNQPVANEPTTAVIDPSKQRKWRNYLLDARFQLKFTAYVVAITLVVCAALGAFLYSTTSTLFREMEVAVEARGQAAETSKELGKATLSNEVLQHMDDPAFEKTLLARSADIDRAYEAETQAISAARDELVRRQRLTLFALFGGLLAFIVLVAFACIVATHKIVGPLHRVKRMAAEVAAGKLAPPSYGLRPGDELRDVFEAFASMVGALRNRGEAELSRVSAALEVAEREKASEELIRALQTLEAKMKGRLE